MDTLYVSPDGTDGWSGRLKEPNQDRTDGPLATLVGARNRIRYLSQPPTYQKDAWTAQGIAGPITVELRSGVYQLHEPVVFGPDDIAPVHYTAFPGEIPILDGGERLTGWSVGELEGRTCWTLDLPDVARGEWYFQSLFVNGRRCPRPRLPKTGWFWIDDVPGKGLRAEFHEGSASFVAKEGDIRQWHNLTDVEVVVLHYWNDEHMGIRAFDAATRLVSCDRPSIFRLTDDYQPRFAKYYVQNVFEALCEPGEWYLDRGTGTVYYLPLPGESPDTIEVFAPRLTQLLKIAGDINGRPVQNLQFSGITFRNTDAPLPPGGWDPSACNDGEGMRSWPNDGDYASAPQAAFNIPGAISFTGARGCSIDSCLMENLGWYAVEVADGCQSIRIVGNEMRGLGAGGVKINGSDAQGPRNRRTCNNVVTDNHIHHAGRVFHQAVGIFVQHAFGNLVAHNHIHDLFYSGISCGWVWGFMESVCRDNAVENNHIHHLGFGHLSDMGGIYMLGVQPGTTIRGNLIHDVMCSNYGAHGIYLDEGSSHIVVENNLTHDTGSEGFVVHFGRENIVRNNIFVGGGVSQVQLGKTIPEWRAFTFHDNIVVSEGGAIYGCSYGSNLWEPGFASDHNILWSTCGKPWSSAAFESEDRMDIEQLRAVGLDVHSLVADPQFSSITDRDFRLSDRSPALSLGFKPFDLSKVGPRQMVLGMGCLP